MLRFENIHIQIVDTPPLAEGRLESRLFGLIRNADVLVMVVDLGGRSGHPGGGCPPAAAGIGA